MFDPTVPFRRLAGGGAPVRMEHAVTPPAAGCVVRAAVERRRTSRVGYVPQAAESPDRDGGARPGCVGRSKTDSADGAAGSGNVSEASAAERTAGGDDSIAVQCAATQVEQSRAGSRLAWWWPPSTSGRPRSVISQSTPSRRVLR